MTGKNSDDDENVSIAIEAFDAAWANTAIWYKHQAFKAEREWRLVIIVDGDLMRAEESLETNVHIRARSGNLVPSFELSFDKLLKESKIDELGVAFPVRELIIGPTLHPENSKHAATMLLNKLNRSLVPRIRLSGIPLRTQ